MPPVIIPVVTAVGAVASAVAPLAAPLAVAGATAGVTALVQKGAREKEAEAQKKAVETQQRGITLAEQQAKAEEQQTKTIFAENIELQRQQLALEANRNRIETLASLKALKQRGSPIVVNPSPQPIQQQSFVDRINNFIGSLF